MPFDARAAKLLEAGQHFTISECPGLRLEATLARRAWIYRYKSPVDGRMKQTKIGEWPAMSLAGATVEWEKLRQGRSAGVDLAEDKRAARQVQREKADAERERKRAEVLTVRKVCDIYLAEHVLRHRAKKGADTVRSLFQQKLGALADLPAAKVTRTQAFDLLNSHIETPVQAAKLRAELGAAWEYMLDSGHLPESVPNWWRLVMRGRLRSKGKRIDGETVGTTKRVLSPTELGVLIRWLPNFTRLLEDSLTLYMWTCARGSEIVAMEAHEITEEGDGLWWTVPKAKTKNSWREQAGDLRVPLVGRAEVIVRRRLGVTPVGFLFPSHGVLGHPEQKTIGATVWTHMPYSGTRPTWDRPRLPVTNWAPHDLRRTCRTQLAAIGCLDEVAEAVLGHAKTGINGVYNRHAYDRERREWLTKLSCHLELLARQL